MDIMVNKYNIVGGLLAKNVPLLFCLFAKMLKTCEILVRGFFVERKHTAKASSQ